MEEEVKALREELRQRERELEAVRRITAALHAQVATEDLVRQTLLTAVDTVHATAGSVLLYDHETDELVFRYVIGETAALLTDRRMPASQGVVGRVFLSGVAEITHDAPADEGHFREIDHETQFRTRDMVTVPLQTTAGAGIGVMQILNRQQGRFTENDRAVLEILSGQAASAMETALLHEEARLAELARTVGNISHDIKNMVAPSVIAASTLRIMLERMFGALDVLRGAPPDGEPWEAVEQAIARPRAHFQDMIRRIGESADAVQERAREIANSVKGQAAPPSFQPARAEEVAGRVLADLELPARQAQVQLLLEAPPDLPPAELDAKRLYHALYNLVNNALPETPSGGTVTVRLAADPDPARPDGGELRIVVADTGRGMPEAIRRTLFTDRATTTKPGGTGLGTRIVRNVVELHHGRVTAESADGQGTTVTLRLPLRQSLEVKSQK